MKIYVINPLDDLYFLAIAFVACCQKSVSVEIDRHAGAKDLW